MSHFWAPSNSSPERPERFCMFEAAAALINPAAKIGWKASAQVQEAAALALPNGTQQLEIRQT
eukprot:15476022-Alexandrium_andersonii.AAC.1